MNLQEVDKDLLKEVIKEILIEDYSLFKNALKEILIENQVITSQTPTEKRVLLQQIVEEDFQEYNEVFKALA